MRRGKVTQNAPAEFPHLRLKLQPPMAPMDAKAVADLPSGAGWQYEPKWDGFRALVFRDGDELVIQSKAGQPLQRYFPELVEALRKIPDEQFVVDGEIVIEQQGRLDFDALLQRIHPAASRITRLSRETPAHLLLFDLLEEGDQVLVNTALRERRHFLEVWARKHLEDNQTLRLSPCSTEAQKARDWLRDFGAIGCDGVMAKRRDEPYHAGDRKAMQKIKAIRTADCVVGGYRMASKGGEIGSLLLGLYNEEGKLDHVGFTSSFNAADRAGLKERIVPAVPGTAQVEEAGFSGNAPGGPSRWNAYNPRAAEWVALLPQLVVEVSYDHFSGGRFRHGTKLLRWRPDKAPRQCTKEQIAALRAA